MIDILKRIFIGVAVGMSIFFLKTQVFAATFTPSTSQYDARFATVNCSTTGRNCFPDNWGSYQGTVNMGTAIARPSGTSSSGFPYILTMLSLKYSYNSGFIAGNTYSFVVRVNTSYDVSSTYKSFAKYNFSRGGTTTSNLTDSNIASATLDRVVVDNTDSKVFYLYFSVTPSANINHIWFYVTLIDINFTYSDFSQIDSGNVVVRHQTANFTEGSNSYIQQNTNAILQQTREFVQATAESTTQILDADAPADFSYYHSYDTSDFDSAESDMMDSINPDDTDLSEIVFDRQSWAPSFTFIWNTITSFVQANVKVFLAITTYLTLSFVGLVIGRS